MTQFLLSITLLSVLGSSVAFANKEAGNGGDICEDQVKIVRDDIGTWIKNGSSAGLHLPNDVSLSQYDAGMLAQIAKAKSVARTIPS